jgi:hypothetical protein
MCVFLEETRDLDCLPRETAAANTMAPGEKKQQRTICILEKHSYLYKVFMKFQE